MALAAPPQKKLLRDRAPMVGLGAISETAAVPTYATYTSASSVTPGFAGVSQSWTET